MYSFKVLTSKSTFLNVRVCVCLCNQLSSSFLVYTYTLYIESPRPNTNRHVHAHKYLFEDRTRELLRSRTVYVPLCQSSRQIAVIIIISLLMSPLLGQRSSLWITHKENIPYPTTRPQCELVSANDCKRSRDQRLNVPSSAPRSSRSPIR
jgi:hypothetical protein